MTETSKAEQRRWFAEKLRQFFAIRPSTAWVPWSRFVIGSLVLALVMAVLVVPETTVERLQAAKHAWLPVRFWSEPQGGLIRIEAPRVFTRERLVNDRFDEAAWLQSRLDLTSKLLDERAFARPGSVRIVRQDLAMSAGGPSVIDGDEAPPREVATAAELLLDDGRFELPEHLQTELALGYRENLRRRLIAENLDDTHDIDGNTLYRLDFGADIVPPPFTDAVAVVEVTLSERATEQDANERQEPVLVAYYEELLEEWRAEIERQASRLFNDRLRTVSMDGRFMPDEAAHLNRFLEVRFRELMTGKAANDPEQKRPAADLQQARALHRNAMITGVMPQMIRSQLGRHVLPSDTPEWQPPDVRNYREYCRNNRDTLPGDVALFDGTVRLPASQQCISFPRNWELLAELDVLDTMRRLSEAANDVALEECGLLSPELAEASGWPPISAYAATARARCPQLDARWASVEMQVGMLEPWERRTRAIGEFVRFQLENQIARDGTTLKISEFFNIDISMCNSAQCDIRVWPKFWRDPIKSPQHFDQESAPERAAALRRHLNIGARALAYRVLPDEALVFSDETSGYGLLAQWGSDGVDVTTERRSTERRIEAVGGVVGIGDWGAAPASEEHAQTRFGWLAFTGADNLRRASPAPRHLPLAALVSLPGWWRHVVLDVRACWRHRGDLADPAQGAPLCGAQPRYSQTLHLQLPGSASEISRRLKFDVVNYPFVDTVEAGELVVEIGRSAKLPIRGGRLWKSPRVLLGQQWAAAIQVLPDMNGIIAEFHCVEPPPGYAGDWGQPPGDTTLRVWTSEGVTPPIPVRYRLFTSRYVDRPDEPCVSTSARATPTAH